VEMSMAFQRPAIESDACPGCRANPRLLQDGPRRFNEDQNIECNVCGLTYRRMTTRRARLPRFWGIEGPTQTYPEETNGTKPLEAFPAPSTALVRKSESNLIIPDDDILSFRRVVILRRKAEHSHGLDPIDVERNILYMTFEILLEPSVSNNS